MLIVSRVEGYRQNGYMQQIAGLNLESILDQLQDLSVNDRLLIERAYRKAERAKTKVSYCYNTT